jgi:predicted RNA-binding protein with EMAP domain
MVVTAAEWRKMGLSEILESLETALNVIENEDILSFEDFKKLLDDAARIIQVIINNADKDRGMLIDAFIDDLEGIKALLEEYRVGEALDYINARLKDYMEGEN